MPLDASRNSAVLPILGLLIEKPSHAYDLTRTLRERYRHLTVTRSTVTSLLKVLERAGSVSPREPERVDNRPARTTYELTEAGVAGFRSRVEAGLRDTAAASVDFVVAVAYVGILPSEQAASVLDGRGQRLAEEVSGLAAHPVGVHEVHMIEVAYWRTIVEAEISWVRTLAERIRCGDIEWPLERSGEQAGIAT